MKNKDVEDIVLEAINSMYPTKNGHIDNVIKITKEAFAAHRESGFQELQIKNLERLLEDKNKEIFIYKNIKFNKINHYKS